MDFGVFCIPPQKFWDAIILKSTPKAREIIFQSLYEKRAPMEHALTILGNSIELLIPTPEHHDDQSEQKKIMFFEPWRKANNEIELKARKFSHIEVLSLMNLLEVCLNIEFDYITKGPHYSNLYCPATLSTYEKHLEWLNNVSKTNEPKSHELHVKKLWENLADPTYSAIYKCEEFIKLCKRNIPGPSTT